jgi:hypothetical protein
MNQENFEYLQNTLRYTGFGDKLNKELEMQLQNQPPEFTLKTDFSINKSRMETTLHFRKSDKSEMYFFNKYDAELKNEGKDQNRSQTFYITKGGGITSKEAFNLLEGRAVNKDFFNQDGEKYNAWVRLDFESKDKYSNYEMNKYHNNYGYDLEKTLEKYPIKDMINEESRKILLASLRKGNLQSVIIEKDGRPEMIFIEANPQFKSINMYDCQMQPVLDKSLKKNFELSQQLGQGSGLKQEEKRVKGLEMNQELKPENKNTAKKLKTERALESPPEKKKSKGKELSR